MEKKLKMLDKNVMLYNFMKCNTLNTSFKRPKLLGGINTHIYTHNEILLIRETQ